MQLNGDIKVLPHLAYVATLPHETLMSAKQAINDKLQGSAATRLRCGGVVNNQLKKGFLLSPCVNFFKSVNIWQHAAKRRRKCESMSMWSEFKVTLHEQVRYRGRLQY